MSPGKSEVNMGGIKKYVWLYGVMSYKERPCTMSFV